MGDKKYILEFVLFILEETQEDIHVISKYLKNCHLEQELDLFLPQMVTEISK